MVQAIGAPESEALNFGNPKKIDGDGAIALVEAAVAAGIDQYVMVTSLGTAKIGFPAGDQTSSSVFHGFITSCGFKFSSLVWHNITASMRLME